MLGSIIVAVAVQAAQPSVQQAFDAASALQAEGKAAEALAAWEALEKRVANNRRTRAIIAARKAMPLYRLGRRDDATLAARSALADMPEGDASLREDRYNALLLLGAVARSALDYAGATTLFADAERFAQAPGEKLGALLAQAETAIFVNPDRARGALDRADAIMAPQKVADSVAGDFQRMRALLLLNIGDIAGARKMTTKAVQTLGGLSTRVDLRDVQARSDAAIAALLAGDKDDARKYMAYTGAGRLGPDKSLQTYRVTPPDCGGDYALKPSDVAVVQFSIDTDGSVMSAEPVYAAGGGLVALEFARAAKQWQWKPEEVAKLPPFYRHNVRLELRCSTAFSRPSLNDMLADELALWLKGRNIALTPDERRTAERLEPALRAELADIDRQGGDPVKALPVLYRLVVNPAVGREETVTLGTRALAIADAAGAPPLARLAFAQPVAQAASAQNSRTATRQRIEAMLADPRFAADAQARSVLKLELSDTYRAGSDQQMAILRDIGSDKGLAANDLLRVGALVRLASAERQAGRLDQARAAFEQSGVSADQCALLDKAPSIVSTNASFPAEAQAWGFEGWAQTEGDVDADGKAVNTRVVASYPPFVFSDAARQTFATARYSKTFRPGGGLGCGGQVNRIRFRNDG